MSMTSRPAGRRLTRSGRTGGSTSAGRSTRRGPAGVRARLPRRADERGDVPGWVLITLMTAGLVTLLWATAGDLLQGLFENAVTSVGGG